MILTAIEQDSAREDTENGTSHSSLSWRITGSLRRSGNASPNRTRAEEPSVYTTAPSGVQTGLVCPTVFSSPPSRPVASSRIEIWTESWISRA
jgi:hypothetical protein